MGRSVAKLLAAKGANVLIVARGIPNLEETVEIISVNILPCFPFMSLNYCTESSDSPLSALSLHQRRSYVAHRSRPSSFRGREMEQQPAPRHSLVLRRYFPSRPLHRVRPRHPSRTDGQQLFLQRLYSAHYSPELALSDLEGERA